MIPDGPEPLFQLIERVPGRNYWRVQISDDTSDDRPVFECKIPRTSKQPPFTPDEIAIAGAQECMEARGLVVLQEFTDNIPIFTAVYAANGRQVFCVRSSDPSRAQPVDLNTLRERAATAIAAAQAARRKAGRAA